mmetsp:Transcript_2958/g.5116  ORF Transcript_2958/g.5116 Transcript_2958/m.5116 type:complete len:488 (+) Transcript_2958:64-1527(+)
MAQYAIFMEEAKHFMQDNDKKLVWLLRAAHHLPGHELCGQEEWEAKDDEPLARLVTHVESLESNDPNSLCPRPTTGEQFFPLVYVIRADQDGADCLKKLEALRFTRGGVISVFKIPENPWCRKSQQDVSEEDRWAWGTLMPLYFREIGRQETQWLVSFFGTRWIKKGGKSELEITRQIGHGFLRQQWNADKDRLFARHVGVALLHPVNAGQVLVLTVYQHDRNPQKPGVWALPGGSVDRAVDTTWDCAAMREFNEEVNPSGLEAWGAHQAFDKTPWQLLSFQNLLPRTNTQNMSRPSLNFVVARATLEFYHMTLECAKHSAGGRCISLPTDFVTVLPAPFPATSQQRETHRYWTDKRLPFLEHDRFEWQCVNLNTGKPDSSQVHPYVTLVAKALQQDSVPRWDSSTGPGLANILRPAAPQHRSDDSIHNPVAFVGAQQLPVPRTTAESQAHGFEEQRSAPWVQQDLIERPGRVPVGRAGLETTPQRG